MAKVFYGIIGWPLTQTFSPGYFNEKFEKLAIDASYLKLPLENIDAFPTLLQSNPALKGLNVTVPYKTAVMAYLDELSDDAKEMGAVNCIHIVKGKLKGYNTDWLGFTNSLKPLLKPQHADALILGTGGAAKAIAYSLKKLGINFRLVSRVGDANAIKYSDLTKEIIEKHKLIINTTPLGMAPNEDKAPPIPYEFLTADHLLYDIVYTPAETKFLSLGKDHGATIKNGLEMLHLQAEASWEIWNS